MITSTLARYIAKRFLRTILEVFAVFFAIIVITDFIDLLRRSGDTPGATVILMAYLALLRSPVVSEQVLPFAVLFGAMAAFLNLSRRLELVIARAAGVSVWQFLAPALLVAAAVGVASVTLYNPVSSSMKAFADAEEDRIFGGSMHDDGGAHSLWLRQRSIDGQAIVRAEQATQRGAVLDRVTAFLFEPNGSFLERVTAAKARLSRGFWSLEDARVEAPGEETRDVHTYLLPTTLTAAQVTQSFISPESVPFWSLPGLAAQTEQAGLNATPYKLYYQTLLARPLLLVAMVLVAASFSLRFFRFGGVSRMVIGGVLSGFGLFSASSVVANFGTDGLLSVPLAAWSPAIVGTMLGTLVLLYQEDG